MVALLYEILSETTERALTAADPLVTGKHYRLKYRLKSTSSANVPVGVEAVLWIKNTALIPATSRPLTTIIALSTHALAGNPTSTLVTSDEQIDFQLPIEVMDSTYQFAVQVNDNQALTELDSSVASNTSVFTTLTFAVTHVDLSGAVTSITYPQSCGAPVTSGTSTTYTTRCAFGVAGSSIAVNFTVTNNGTAIAAASKAIVDVYKGTDLLYSSAPQDIASIAAGASTIGTADIPFAATDFGNDFTAKVRVDTENSLVESSETNNTSVSYPTMPFSVHVRPEATIETIGDGRLSCRPGTTGCTPTATVTLQGDCPVSPETGQTVTGSWCRIEGAACGSSFVSGTSFPVNYPVSVASADIRSYRFECTANDLYNKAETMINFTSP
ncbi:MAG: hypothetical protein HQM15_08955 [Deltaproteobacteria bacterium]|nr:hypothetical protein [Deltaproteobacteria bacterium]